MIPEVLLLDYGAGNVHSAARALERAGMTVRVSENPADVPHAPALVVPGQGHFRQVMEAFDRHGFHGPVMDAAGAGVRVPGDLAVVGFDDLPQAAGFSLTTVAQPGFEIGRRAVELLIGRLAGKAGPFQRVLLPTRLVVRGSSGEC